jgi:hypothetical protein
VWCTDQTGRRRDSDGRPLNVARAGPRQGDARMVALGLVRPPRMPLDVAEMKEEQQMGLEKLGFRDKSKCETIKR